MSVGGAAIWSFFGGVVGYLVDGKRGAIAGSVGGAAFGYATTSFAETDDEPGDVLADVDASPGVAGAITSTLTMSEGANVDTSFASDDGTVTTETDPKLSTLEPITAKLMANFIAAARANGFSIGIESAARSYAKQKALYDAYASGESKIVASDPDKKKGSHLYGAAIDVHFMDDAGNEVHPYTATPDQSWKALADFSKGQGVVPGYYFSNGRDIVHFERPGWRDLVASGDLQLVA